MWLNVVLIRILGEDDCTSQLCVKGGAKYKNAVLLVAARDGMTIFGHIMAKCGKMWI